MCKAVDRAIELAMRFEVPLEAYDGTAGGYRNPMRPTELLRPLPPGH
jgi:hypothetical protein